jgi:exosortase family protein XrtG
VAELSLYLLATAVWAGAVTFFWRARAWLPYYILGAAGCAVLVVIGSREFLPIESIIRQATAHSVDMVAPLLGVNTTLEHVDPGSLMVIGVPHQQEWTVLAVGLESSGLLEAAALLGIVAFFPAQTASSRIVTIVIALALTFLANVFRVLIIVATVGYLGQGYLDFAHVVVGRAVFFIMAIGIFWFAITAPTLRRVNQRLSEAPL